jgi:diguanylate cyclase (GGDEF)-like protein
MLLAFAATLLEPRPSSWAQVGLAALVSSAAGALILLAPWDRLPVWAQAFPALATFITVGLLSDATSGAASGYGPLVLLPVMTLALTQAAWLVALGSLAAGAVFLVPTFLLGQASYPPGDLRRALLTTAALGVVGFAVRALVNQKRVAATEAEERAEDLAAHASAIDALAMAVHGVATSDDGEQAICESVRLLTDASVTFIARANDAQSLEIVASSGRDFTGDVIRIGKEPSGCGVAFVTGERFFVEDVRTSTTTSYKLKKGGAMCVSMLYEPVFLNERCVGVLAAGWTERTEGVNAQAAAAIELLGHQTAITLHRSQLIHQLEASALTDELTQVANRRQWEQDLPRELARAGRADTPVAIAMIDIDHFKRFNDTHGHQGGDDLLRKAAAAWKTALRAGDVITRYGGEEFGVILPSCSPDEALIVAERLRSAAPEGTTCSIGLASWRPGETHDELVARADAALYAAKNSGRNCVVVAEDGEGARVAEPAVAAA